MATSNWFTQAFGAAVDDIRKHVIEEPWFGRAVTPPYRPGRGMSDELGWTKEGQSPEQASPAHDIGHDFDR